jgi:hypothetical protein
MAFDYCERVFPHLEEMVARLKADAPSPPIIRLGVCRLVSREKILAAVGFLKDRGPSLMVKVTSGGHAEIEEMLRRRTIDLALTDADCSAQLGRDFRSRLAGSFPIAVRFPLLL